MKQASEYLFERFVYNKIFILTNRELHRMPTIIHVDSAFQKTSKQFQNSRKMFFCNEMHFKQVLARRQWIFYELRKRKKENYETPHLVKSFKHITILKNTQKSRQGLPCQLLIICFVMELVVPRQTMKLTLCLHSREIILAERFI